VVQRPPRIPPEHLLGDLGWPIFDDEGRPLDEGRLAQELWPAVPLTYERCPHAGSRATSDKLMNASALDQVGRHLRRTLADFGYFHRALLARLGNPQVTPSVLWHLSMATLYTPWFMLAREPDLRTRLPVRIAGLHKIMIGLKQLTEQLAWRECYGLDIPALEVDALLELTELRRLLIGPTEVCPAPETMIRKTLDVLLLGTSDEEAVIDTLIPAIDEMFRFGACCTNLLVLRRTLDMIAICVARELGLEPGNAALDAVHSLSRHVALGIAELDRGARGEALARIGDLMASVSEGADGEIVAVLERVAALWDGAAAPEAVFAAGERAVLDAVAILRREAHAAVGRSYVEVPFTDADALGSHAQAVLAAARL
jgi:hypothetical protein